MITGSPKANTGFGLSIDKRNQALSFFIYSSINVPLNYQTAAGSFSAQAWQYLGIVNDYDQGKLKKYVTFVNHGKGTILVFEEFGISIKFTISKLTCTKDELI